MRTVTFTREGKRFFVAVFLIGCTAFGSSNNLIYLLFSLMLSISVISVTLAFINLRGLTFNADLGEPLYAHTKFSVAITCENRNFFSAYSITLLLPFIISPQLFVPVVPQGSCRKTFHDVVIGRRGRYRMQNCRIRTGFPFIFMYALKSVSYRADLLVYPQLIDVSPWFGVMEASVTERETKKSGQEGDFILSREYMYGEDSRKIDWKATAKTQKTMVSEHVSGESMLATVILDNSSRADKEIFEKSVSIAASLCGALIDRGFYTRLVTCTKVVPFGIGRSHLFKILDILAVITEKKTVTCYTGETLEGTCFLVKKGDISAFAEIEHLCSEVINARNI